MRYFGEGHYDHFLPQCFWVNSRLPSVKSRTVCSLLPGPSCVWDELMRPGALCWLILFLHRPGDADSLRTKDEDSPKCESFPQWPLRETDSSKDCFMYWQGKVWFKPLDTNWAPKSLVSYVLAGICWAKQAYGLHHIWNMWGASVVCVMASLL